MEISARRRGDPFQVCSTSLFNELFLAKWPLIIFSLETLWVALLLCDISDVQEPFPIEGKRALAHRVLFCSAGLFYLGRSSPARVWNSNSLLYQSWCLMDEKCTRNTWGLNVVECQWNTWELSAIFQRLPLQTLVSFFLQQLKLRLFRISETDI